MDRPTQQTTPSWSSQDPGVCSRFTPSSLPTSFLWDGGGSYSFCPSRPPPPFPRQGSAHKQKSANYSLNLVLEMQNSNSCRKGLHSNGIIHDGIFVTNVYSKELVRVCVCTRTCSHMHSPCFPADKPVCGFPSSLASQAWNERKISRAS